MAVKKPASPEARLEAYGAWAPAGYSPHGIAIYHRERTTTDMTDDKEKIDETQSDEEEETDEERADEDEVEGEELPPAPPEQRDLGDAPENRSL